jgi:2-polyprenyl-6-methoxyphenol hydroxylase-like FAD-dependent oxidoreductase
VAVFEQHDQLSEVNTGLSLWAFAVRRLEQLGLAGQLEHIGRPIERVIHRSVTGRSLGDVAVAPLNARLGVPSYEIHRSKLQLLLAAALGDDAITFGRRCIGVHQDAETVQAEFEEGTTASADLLVGADGVHSVVRRAVPSASATQLRRAEIGVWRGIAPVGQGEVPMGFHIRVLGPATLFGVARVSDELVRWYAGARFREPRPSSGPEYRQKALDEFGDWPSPVRTTLQETADADYLFNDTPHAPPLRTWGSGRITLLGDAAHASVPTLGISAGLAIEDASVLAECLRAAGGDLSGIRAYEARRRPVAARVVRAARLFGRVLLIRRRPAERLREIGTRIAPQTLAIRWLVNGARWR